jgi:molybdopterin/thiamine biosynthesis adenylyltransferase
MGILSSSPRDPMLTAEDLARFARPIRLAEIGAKGQARLRQAGVLVVGAGGLGSSALIHLAASGVGRIGTVNPDRVELDNLHRQILHGIRAWACPKWKAPAGDWPTSIRRSRSNFIP